VGELTASGRIKGTLIYLWDDWVSNAVERSVANQKSFGRRICLEHRVGNSTKPITALQTTKPGPLAYSVERTFPVQKRPKTTTLDEELQQWKLARRQN